MRSNFEKLVDAFRRSIEIDDPDDVVRAQYRETKGWDSVAHMRLVGEIEAEFDLMLETDDVLDLGSFDKACEVLTRHNVHIEP
jgi:acyl carrier protein